MRCNALMASSRTARCASNWAANEQSSNAEGVCGERGEGRDAGMILLCQSAKSGQFFTLYGSIIWVTFPAAAFN